MHDFERVMTSLSLSGIFRNFFITISEDKFSVCYWNAEVCCNLLLSASQIKIEDGAQDHCILRLSVQA